jgi:hypothetical protein
MKNIVWLASYPKSGNTWFRIFLENLIQDKEQPVDINQLENTPIASSRLIFDEAVGIPAAELSNEEVDFLRPEVYQYLAREAKETLFLKIHDAYTLLDNLTPLVPSEVTRGVIYFIRNPLDVAVSFANHSGISVTESIARMSNESYSFCESPGRLHNQLRQRILSWSSHVHSWIDCKDLDLHLVRYEDMKTNPVKTFSRAVKFAGLNKSQAQIEKALKYSNIEELQHQERERGFREKASQSPAFFNKGKIGYWREELSEKHVKSIIKAHKNLMERFGYLDTNGMPVF